MSKPASTKPPTTDDDATIARIITHMNKDHTLSLYDYLGHYCRTELDPSSPDTTIKMLSITLDRLILEYTCPTFNLPVKAEVKINPPMESFTEARTKLVSMAKEAAASRGFATHQIDRFVGPFSPAQLVVAAVTLLYVPGVRDVWLWFLPVSVLQSSVMAAFIAYPWTVFTAAVSVHVMEAVFVLRPLLNKWRVPLGTRCLWYASNLVEGYSTIMRFKDLVYKTESH